MLIMPDLPIAFNLRTGPANSILQVYKYIRGMRHLKCNTVLTVSHSIRLIISYDYQPC